MMDRELNIFGQFADCELTAMQFEHLSLQVKIYNPSLSEFTSVAFSNAVYVVLESDHLQNVISRAYVFENSADALQNVEFKAWAEARGIAGTLSSRFGNYRVVYIVPIAGIECVIVCSNINIE